MQNRPDTIAVFPLRLVLFPHGILPLRIFETRYLNMIRDCSRDDAPFGVCLILDNDDENQTSELHQARMTTVGTAAEIIDFNTMEDGLLSVVARGTRRFQIHATHVQHDGLVRADIDWLNEPKARTIQPQHAMLVDILRQLHGQISKKIRHQSSPKDAVDMQSLLNQCDYDDAAMVGYRLADLLPLNVHDQQVLLEMDDPEQRLGSLLRAISVSNDSAP